MADDRPPSDDDLEPTRSMRESDIPLPPPATAELPEVVDGYRILRLLGQGGMGMVFEAEQQEPRRRVALKVLRGSAHTDELSVRLFRREVETLARLRHPNIAAIYGSGRLPDGRPYFVMELVEGPTLDVYLSGRPSPSHRDEMVHRLSIMRKISEAVHYAHQRGVIHRDLKPSNLVITEGFGSKSSGSTTGPSVEVKILDFGLARITDDDPAASLMSDVGTIRGTLPYMSPEQARGEADDLDVRSDVYALGVILYELITGIRPYDVRRAALAEAVRVICEEPPRPMRDTPSGMHKVDADLQTIVMRALAKEAERRYSSAAALAEDMERYLTSQPILARPPSAAYQLRKLVDRNRPLVAALGLVLLVVIAASVVSTTLFIRARTEATKAQQSAAFLRNMLTGVGPSVARGRDTAMLREILDQTAKRVTDELAGQPEVAADIQQILGHTYQQLGELDLAAVHARAALTTHRRLHRGPHPAVAQDLTILGYAAWNRDNLAAAESLLVEALSMRRRLDSDPNEATANALTDLGNVLAQAGRYDEADSLLRDASAMKHRLFGPDHESVALGLNSLASLAHYRGNFSQADSLHRLALAMHRRTLGELHPDVAVDIINLGLLQVSRGNFAAAESLIHEAVALSRRIHGGDHPHVAAALEGLADVMRRQGNWAGAEATYRDVLEMNRHLHGEGTAPVADALNNLALVVAEREGSAAALPLQREALAIHRRTLVPDHPQIATDLGNLAYCLTGLGIYDEADTLYREALRLKVAALGEDHPTVLLMHNNFARLQNSRGDLDLAEELFRKVLAGRKKQFGEMNDQVGISMIDLSNILRTRGRLTEVDSILTRSKAILDSTLGPNHPATLVARGLHGRVLCDLDRAAEAEAELRSSRDALAGIYGPAHGRVLVVNMDLARAVAARGDAREADELFRTVIDAPANAISPASLNEARSHYGVHLTRMGRFAAAEKQLLTAEESLRDAKGASLRTRSLVLDGLVALYETWSTAEPAAGKAAEAGRWRSVRDRESEATSAALR